MRLSFMEDSGACLLQCWSTTTCLFHQSHCCTFIFCFKTEGKRLKLLNKHYKITAVIDTLGNFVSSIWLDIQRLVRLWLLSVVEARDQKDFPDVLNLHHGAGLRCLLVTKPIIKLPKAGCCIIQFWRKIFKKVLDPHCDQKFSKNLITLFLGQGLFPQTFSSTSVFNVLNFLFRERERETNKQMPEKTEPPWQR